VHCDGVGLCYSTKKRKCSCEHNSIPKLPVVVRRGSSEESRGNYTGERLKSLRPETYREVVRLLPEPREQVSIREICRSRHVTDDTVKAVEQRESISIAARKQELMMQAARIAKRAADRVEDQIGDAPLTQAVVTFGVMTDKIVALSNDSQQINVTHTLEPGVNLYAKLEALAAAINARDPSRPIDARVETPVARRALLNGETISDSGR
jgi:hypothetical protein